MTSNLFSFDRAEEECPRCEELKKCSLFNVTLYWGCISLNQSINQGTFVGKVMFIKCLQIAEIAANLATSVFNDGNQILITILEKFGLKINRNVCVSLAERDNRRIFTSRQRRLASSFEARRTKKIKKSKEIELFQEQEGISYDPGAF
ncbi:hypothetical protein TNCV_2544741 [Trichonephila clavipes]|nr:hypothetical protein TNCV_2544741 [Trichonephila clavipes]